MKKNFIIFISLLLNFNTIALAVSNSQRSYKSNLDIEKLNEMEQQMDLYNRMGLFGKLNSKEQEYIFIIAFYNNLRLYEEDPKKRYSIIIELFDNKKNDLLKKFKDLKLETFNNNSPWKTQIEKINYQISKIPGTKPLERSLILNIWLYRSGLCPFVRFAFDKWYEIDINSGKIIEELADLSTTYFYRLIPIKEEFDPQLKIGAGAYSNVYRSENGKTIYKVPRNLASSKFASYHEYKSSIYAQQTELAPYLPKLINFDEVTGMIEREFINGISGAELLKNLSCKDFPYDLNQIKEIYDAADLIFKRDRINFDIHPGNMMWSYYHKKWFLVDLGPMPEIGSDYFPRGNFNEYFKKIWLDRCRLMIEVPIRSLDIQSSNDFKNFKIPSEIFNIGL